LLREASGRSGLKLLVNAPRLLPTRSLCQHRPYFLNHHRTLLRFPNVNLMVSKSSYSLLELMPSVFTVDHVDSAEIVQAEGSSVKTVFFLAIPTSDYDLNECASTPVPFFLAENKAAI
jgi:hypothetical protein